MTRRLIALAVLAGCGGSGSDGAGQALIANVRFVAPLDATPVGRFDLAMSRTGGFPDFDPVTTAGDGGDYTLTSEDRDGDGDNEAVLTWPDRWAYDGGFGTLLEFDQADAFSVDLLAAAMDGDVVFARGEAPAEVPASGTVEVDIYVECLLDGCETPRANGAACDDGAQCQSSHCIDDVCCASACDGICEQCTGAGGTCEAIGALQDPDAECGSDPDCKGTCDGNRACAYPDDTTTCGDDVCNVCDGAGACVARPAGSDPADECAACNVCDGSGACAVATGMDPKGDCTGQMNCDGVCDGSGGCDYTAVVGNTCDTAACTSNAVETWACDAAGACVATQAPCDPYVCSAATCPSTCAATATDCVSTAVCALTTAPGSCADSAVGTCVTAAVVDCGADAAALQTAIDGCVAGPCYLRISGPCSAITVQDRDVYVDGLGLATIQGSGTPAATVTEASGQESRLVLAGVTLNSLAGGLNATSTDTDPAEVSLLAGTRVQLSAYGISANNTALVVEDSEIASNTGAGVLATGSSLVAVTRSVLDGNDASGIDISGGSLALACSTIAANGAGSDAPGLSIVNSAFAVGNVFVVRNGGPGGGVGVSVFANVGDPAGQSFQYSTVADNANGGMECFGSIGGQTTVQWSLFGNPTNELVGCASSLSDIPGVEDACGNGTNSPAFVDAPGGDYHLDAAVAPPSCVDALTTCDASGPTDDFDGDPRVDPCTVGADEVP